MKSLAYLISLLLILTLAWMWLPWEPETDPRQPHQILPLSSPPSGGDFTLQSWQGPVSLQDFRGKLVLLYFGYTWCPDVCPTNLGYIALALSKLQADEAQQVQVLFVSVDPERDTPQHLKDYTAFFHQQVLGLTGTEEQLRELAKRYGAAYRKVETGDSASGYLVDHSAFTYLISPDGKLDGQLDHATAPEKIVAEIRRRLSQKAGKNQAHGG